MATINELFISVVNLGLESAKMVADPKDKAVVYAELAKALAMKSDQSAIKEMTSEIEPIPEGKDSIKETPKAKKEKSKVKKEEPKVEEQEEIEVVSEDEPLIEEKVSEVQPEETVDVALEEEWSDAMMELKSAQMETMQEYMNNYEEESLNGLVEQFSEGNLKSLADITPLNIDAFLAYLKAVEAAYEEEA